MVEKVSQRMSVESINFVDKINTNMIRAKVIEKALPRTEVFDRILEYFKLNNERYIELIKMEKKE